jgi:phosphoribosylaminoimidazole carboxylase PurE protein
MRIMSAHRTPEEVLAFSKDAKANGFSVIIAGAGMAAHLAGVVAAHTTLPVIGVPIASSSLGGLDALLAMVQMPPGVPVATMGIGKAGAKNAALLAIEILALNDEALRKRLAQYRSDMRKTVLEEDDSIKNS